MGPGRAGRPRRWAVAATVIVVAAVLCSAACGGNDNNGSTAHRPTQKPTPKPTGDPGDWVLTFDDEFSGAGLDTRKWSKGWLAPGITPPVNSTEEECYDPAQVTESGGALNLNLITKSEPCGIAHPVYTSGIVNSDGKFSYSYGFLEARAWLPAVRGEPGKVANWPAVWTDGQHWPADGEDDIVEGIDGQACPHFHSAARPNGIGASHGTAGHPASGCVKKNLAGGWHTFGADWEPGSVTYYYDGQDIGSVTSGVTSAPMYLVINYAAGMPYQSPSTMKVDYVRVWQKASQ
jgi:beta-glucanase (GH16 family)